MPDLRRAVAALALSCALAAPGAAHELPAGAVPAPPAEEPLIRAPRQLTFAGQRSGEGYFSPDGRWMVFQSERDAANPFYGIYSLDLGTGATKLLSPGVGKTTCAWVHPSGKRVLFASTHEDPGVAQKQKAELEFRASGQQRRYSWDYDEFYDLYDLDLATGKMTPLAPARGYDAEGAWSPDGRKVAFASNRAAYTTEVDKTRLEQDPAWFMDLYLWEDGTLRQLTDAPGYDGGAFFSADGSRICWRRFSADGATAEVYTMKADGTDQRQVTRLGAMSWAPYFHPSGDYLIFATNKHGFGNFELYIVDARGEKEPVRVTNTEGFDGLPVFTPDGRGLSWTTTRGGKSQIWKAGWNDAQARELLGLPQVARPADLPTPQVAEAALRRDVSELASDANEGRMTGSPGARRAAEYVAKEFEQAGLEPAGDDGTWFQKFEFVAGVSPGPGNRLTVGSQDYRQGQDWRPLAFSSSSTVEPTGVVFAGYGIVAPASNGQQEYDSYVHLDVKDKWVVVFRYLPEDVTPETRQHLSRYAGLRYKATQARNRGAKGLIVVSGPRSGAKDQLVPLTVDATIAGSSMPMISVTDAVGEIIVGRPLKPLQEKLDTGEPTMGFPVPDLKVAATLDIQQEKRVGENVLGRLPGRGPRAGAVVLGAHLDHLGRGLGGDSLAREGERGAIHNGADDNASGVAALLELARRLAEDPPARDVVFAAWEGEEIGILGSSHYAKGLAKGDVIAYLNMDMVGRLDKKVVVQGLASSPDWAAVVETANAPLDLPIGTSEDAYLPTDSTAFYLQKVPFLSFFTGAHSEYHTPRDKADTLNYEGLARITNLVERAVRLTADSSKAPAYAAVEKPQQMSERAGLRAYLGTIPDYAQGDVKGLRLSGAAKGGPAEKAGVQPGDVVVELAGRKVENIYDYTYALEALKAGEKTTMVVQRAGGLVRLEIVPEARR